MLSEEIRFILQFFHGTVLDSICYLCVDVLRRLNVSMPHYFLNDFNINVLFTQPGAKCMPYMVTGKMRNKERIPAFISCFFGFIFIIAFVNPFLWRN